MKMDTHVQHIQCIWDRIVTCDLFNVAAPDIGQKRKREEAPVYEQAENPENPLRCPVKLYEFYLSKWYVYVHVLGELASEK